MTQSLFGATKQWGTLNIKVTLYTGSSKILSIKYVVCTNTIVHYYANIIIVDSLGKCGKIKYCKIKTEAYIPF